MENLFACIISLEEIAKKFFEIYKERKQYEKEQEHIQLLNENLKKSFFTEEKKQTANEENCSKLLECAETNKKLTETIESLKQEQERNTQELKILNRRKEKASDTDKGGFEDLIKEKQKEKAKLELDIRNNKIKQEKNIGLAKKITGNKDINLENVLKTKLNNKEGALSKLFGEAVGARGAGAAGAARGAGAAGAAGAAGVAVAAVAALKKALTNIVKLIDTFISKYAEYIKTSGDILIKQYENDSKILIATATSNFDTIKDLSEGQISSGKNQIDNIIASTESINDNILAWKKFHNQFSNFIPIIGALNKKEEFEMELKNKRIKVELERARNFLGITSDFLKLSEDYIKKQDKAIHNFQRATGMTLSQTRLVEKRLFAFGPRLGEMFNKTIEDVLKFQTDFIAQSGRNMNMTNADYDSAMAMDRLIGGQNFSQFSAKMTLFNKSVTSSADIMFDTYKSLGSMGLSQQKVVKSILNNMRMAEKYSFKNGVQGYIDMVKWAENFRVNLSSISTAVDKMQKNSLEQVIQQSAKLQVLGGKFAMNSDPFAMYYESMNDAADYAKRIVDSFKGYGTINQKTGETVFSGNERKLIMEASSAWGVNFEDALNMIRENNKKNVVKSQLGTTKLSGDALDSVINKSYFDEEKGQWMVNTIDGNTMAVADVGENDVNKIVGDEINDPLVKYAAQTFSAVDNIESYTKKIAAQIGESDFNDFMGKIKETQDALEKDVVPNIPKINTSIEKLRSFNQKAQIAMLSKMGGIDKNTLLSLETVDENNEKTEEGQTYIDVEMNKDRWYGDAKKMGLGALGLGLITGNIGIAAVGAVGIGAGYIGEWLNSDKDKIEEGIENYKQNNPKATKEEIDSIRKNAYKRYGIKDGFLPSSGMPISVSANKVVPINDGQVTTAVSHPQDSALFAKSGGPFDTLFNGVFKEVDEIYHNVEHLPTSSSIYSSSETNTNTTNNGKFDLQLHGDINLKANGQSYNIMGQLEKDPMFVRSITELICQQLSVNTNGGRNRGLNNRPTI